MCRLTVRDVPFRSRHSQREVSLSVGICILLNHNGRGASIGRTRRHGDETCKTAKTVLEGCSSRKPHEETFRWTEFWRSDVGIRDDCIPKCRICAVSYNRPRIVLNGIPCKKVMCRGLLTEWPPSNRQDAVLGKVTNWGFPCATGAIQFFGVSWPSQTVRSQMGRFRPQEQQFAGSTRVSGLCGPSVP